MTPKKELGVRMPDHEVPRALVNLLGRPIINTTAKSAGRNTYPTEGDRAIFQEPGGVRDRRAGSSAVSRRPS